MRALYNNKIKDVTFSYDKVLSFDGETSVYVQYTCARANSVPSKSKITASNKPHAVAVKSIKQFFGGLNFDCVQGQQEGINLGAQAVACGVCFFIAGENFRKPALVF